MLLLVGHGSGAAEEDVARSRFLDAITVTW